VANELTIRLDRGVRDVAVERVVAPVRDRARRGAAVSAELAEILRQELEQHRRQFAEELEVEQGKVQQACRAARSAAEALRRLREGLLAEAEEQLVALALDIARKVLMQEVAAGRYEIAPILAEALQHVPGQGEVVVHVNPEDHARCRETGQLADDAGNVRFVADPKVRPAECLLETSEGTIESSMEANLARVGEALALPE